MRTLPSDPGYAPLRLGALGASQIVTAGASTAASTEGGVAAASIATYAGYGSVAGPIGAVVGAIIGLVVTKLLTKQYLNVSQLNAAEQAQISAFNQYVSIQGQVPGRQLGLAAMQAIWEGALYSGHFPLNNQRQCYHEGCSQYDGDPSWISGTLTGGASNPFTFAAAWAAMQRDRQSSSAPTTSNVNTLSLTRSGIGPLRGLGGVGPAGTPEAVVLIDNYFIPANQHDNPPWAVPGNNLEHQILYDAADAWLMQQPTLTTPYIAAQPVPLPPAAVALPASSPVSGNVITGPVPVNAQPLNPYATPQLSQGLPPALVANAGSATTTAAATAANLDAAMQDQGYLRVGTTPNGYPLYQSTPACPQAYGQACPVGSVYVYSNGELFPYGSASQVAVSGGAGDGIALPATGIDPQVVGLITGALSQGGTPADAIDAATRYLQTQGITVTPDIQAQLAAVANGPVPPAGIPLPYLVGGALLLILVLR